METTAKQILAQGGDNPPIPAGYPCPSITYGPKKTKNGFGYANKLFAYPEAPLH